MTINICLSRFQFGALTAREKETEEYNSQVGCLLVDCCLLFLLMSRHAGVSWRIWVEETWKGGQLGIVMYWVGQREAGWVNKMVVIPGCRTSGRSETKVHFSHIRRTSWGSFAGLSDGVGSCCVW